MSREYQSRISFANIKNQRVDNNSDRVQLNKENDISFQNLKCLNQPRSAQSKFPNLLKNFDQNLQISPNSITSSGEASVSTGSFRFTTIIHQINKNTRNRDKGLAEGRSSMQDFIASNFQRVQNKIRQQIQQYNNKYSEVTEMLADLHIKDIMKFNEMLEKNEQIYKIILEQNCSQQHIQFNQISEDDTAKIYQVEQFIIKVTSEKNKSFDCRSTYESKNRRNTPIQSVRVSPKVIKDKSPPNYQNKKSSDRQQESDSMRLHQIAKNDKKKIARYDSIQQNHQVTKLEDTPESVKSKISFTAKIKTEKQVIIGMFDRINICESIEQSEIGQNILNKTLDGGRADKEQGIDGCQGRSRGKREHRYGRNSEQ